jgi:arsenate reductase (glutaredoxin)
MITIYHNPNCGTSRNVLAMIRERGIEPKIVEYLKTPLTAKELAALIKAMKVPARAILRDKGDLYNELDLANTKWSDAQLIDFMAKHPVLMNRPIVVTDKSAKLCRPSETVQELLPAA